LFVIGFFLLAASFCFYPHTAIHATAYVAGESEFAGEPPQGTEDATNQAAFFKSKVRSVGSERE